jgi:hypothetical protein
MEYWSNGFWENGIMVYPAKDGIFDFPIFLPRETFFYFTGATMPFFHVPGGNSSFENSFVSHGL